LGRSINNGQRSLLARRILGVSIHRQRLGFIANVLHFLFLFLSFGMMHSRRLHSSADIGLHRKCNTHSPSLSLSLCLSLSLSFSLSGSFFFTQFSGFCLYFFHTLSLALSRSLSFSPSPSFSRSLILSLSLSYSSFFFSLS